MPRRKVQRQKVGKRIARARLVRPHLKEPNPELLKPFSPTEIISWEKRLRRPKIIK